MRQPRILFCVHDDRGLGHLVRLCRVAAGLLDHCSCLLVTGHREAAWIVPAQCEFVRLPAIDSLVPGRAAYWGRRPFVDLDPSEVVHFRSELVLAAVREYSPDAILVDHLAGGRHGEWLAALASSPARKYLLLRGVIDTVEKALTEVFPPAALHLIETTFSRILVACDPKICQLENEYLSSAAAVAARIAYVGYVAPTFSPAERQEARQRRGLSEQARWVVCSAGGGVDSEDMVAMCGAISRQFPDVAFDVVWGPKSRQRPSAPNGWAGSLRIWQECRELPLLHAAADVVICRGGYNSLMEVAAGTASAICIPLDVPDDHEQLLHASRLARHLPIHISLPIAGQVSALLERLLTSGERRWDSSWGEQCGLRFDGVGAIRRVLDNDLGQCVSL